MEVNRCAGKHPNPQKYNQIQGHIQQIEDGGEVCRQVACPQEGHWSRFLHDEEGRVRQDEGVSRDVKAMPVKAGLPAGGFGHKLRFHNTEGAVFVTRASRILDVEEGFCADVPDKCRYCQRCQPAAEGGNTAAEGGVGEEEEQCQQQQRPTP